jgi:hypothetical protein
MFVGNHTVIGAAMAGSAIPDLSGKPSTAPIAVKKPAGSDGQSGLGNGPGDVTLAAPA